MKRSRKGNDVPGAPAVTVEKDLGRIAGFSDGVFAIACTLLILELKVPELESTASRGELLAALKAVWPSFVAFFLAFEAILVAWAGHHKGVNQLVRASKPFLFANGFLLFTITFMPFPTAVLARYINTPQANVAVMFFSAAWLMVNMGFNLWWLSMFRPVRLVPNWISGAIARRITMQMIGGTLLYAANTVLSYWFPIVGVIVILTSQIVWIVLDLGVDEPQALNDAGSPRAVEAAGHR